MEAVTFHNADGGEITIGHDGEKVYLTLHQGSSHGAMLESPVDNDDLVKMAAVLAANSLGYEAEVIADVNLHLEEISRIYIRADDTVDEEIGRGLPTSDRGAEVMLRRAIVGMACYSAYKEAVARNGEREEAAARIAALTAQAERAIFERQRALRKEGAESIRRLIDPTGKGDNIRLVGHLPLSEQLYDLGIRVDVAA